MVPRTSTRYASHIHAYFAYIVSIILMFFLVLLMRKYTPQHLKPYLRVLILNTVVDSLYTFFSFIFYVDWIVIPTDQGLLFFTMITGILEYPPVFVTWVVLGFGILCLYWTLTSVAVNFVYRYFLICQNRQLNLKSFLFAVAISLILPVLIATRVMIMFYPRSDNDQFQSYFNSSEYKYDQNTAVTYILDYGQLNSVTTMVIGLNAVFLPYIIVAISTVAILLTLRKVPKYVNPRSSRLQLEMTIILSIQALMPFLGFGVPLICTYSRALFNLQLPSTDQLTLFSLWLPAINAVSVIFIVTPYRRGVKKFFQREAEDSVGTTETQSKNTTAQRAVLNRSISRPGLAQIT